MCIRRAGNTGVMVNVRQDSSQHDIRRLKDLEKEKDALFSGLEILEKTRLWYLQRLGDNGARQDNMEANLGLGICQEEGAAEAQSFLLRSRIQRANGSLGSVMSEPNVTSSSCPSLPDAVADSDLRWHNTVLTKEVSDKNRQISILEQEKDALLEQLELQQAPSPLTADTCGSVLL